MRTLQKTLFGLVLLAASALGQTTTVTLSLTFPTGVFADLMTHWTDQHSADKVATLAAPISVTDTSITLGQAMAVKPGQTIIIGTDPMAVASISGSTITVVRAIVPGATASPHALGDYVSVLQYASPLDMILAESLQSYALGVVHNLASQNRSAAIVPPTGSFAVR